MTLSGWMQEKSKKSLFDVGPNPYPITGKDWVGLIKAGDVEFIEKLPIMEPAQLRRYILEHHYTMTLTPLDYLFGPFSPSFNRDLAWFGEVDGVRVRPLKRDIGKVSVHEGSKHGYVFDMSPYVSSFEELIPLLESLQSLGCELETFTTIAAIARSLLQSRCRGAFLGYEAVDPIHFIRAAAVYRLGRNEAFRIGTMRESSVFDIKSAYPTEVAKLQAFQPCYIDWVDEPRHDFEAEYGFYRARYRSAPSDSLSLISHRVPVPGYNRLFYPSSGERVGFVGKAMLELQLRAGYDIEILEASQGFIKRGRECRPFELVMKELAAKRDSKFGAFYKLLDTRITGCMAGTYFDVIRDDVVALSTCNHIYAATVVDRIMAKMLEFALGIPKERLIGLSIDGVQALGSYGHLGGSGLGDMVLKRVGEVTKFTDVLGDKDGATKWRDRYSEGQLIIPRARKTLVGTFRCLTRELEQAAERFVSEGGVIIGVPVGSTKRFNTRQSGVDILKESYPTDDISMSDIPILCLRSELIVEEDR